FEYSLITPISLSCLHPDVCSLAQDRGSCKNYTIMWFFDNSLGRCSRFWYGGCSGNENRFWTQKECENRCPTKTPGRRGDVIRLRRIDVCSLAQDRGSCKNYTIMWFFDNSLGRCSRFWYGGCGGNENRFWTQKECENRCPTKTPGRRGDSDQTQTSSTSNILKPQRTVLSVCVLLSARCQLGADRGIQCMGYVQKWYYDKHIGACSPFWYGGCAGNANRFDTEHECFRTCGNKSKLINKKTRSLCKCLTSIMITDGGSVFQQLLVKSLFLSVESGQRDREMFLVKLKGSSSLIKSSVGILS
uniref:BPTI/Kunitz inhibitor domain-containing protein n=1 Tax=Lates calcarifer TaxID=8187 RepID=A0A4W6DPY9_LATCA